MRPSLPNTFNHKHSFAAYFYRDPQPITNVDEYLNSHTNEQSDEHSTRERNIYAYAWPNRAAPRHQHSDSHARKHLNDYSDPDKHTQ